jgi:hypothetical protein
VHHPSTSDLHSRSNRSHHRGIGISLSRARHPLACNPFTANQYLGRSHPYLHSSFITFSLSNRPRSSSFYALPTSYLTCTKQYLESNAFISTKMEAPLTSPNHSKTQSSSYYTSFPSTSTTSGPTSAPQQPAAQPAPQRSTSQDETSPFLRDFNLVAEAAKRAQMAVLMRDLEGIGLQ